MAIRRHVLLPTPAPLALRTGHLLLLPVHRELLEGIGSCDLLLPALPRTRRAAQGDALLVVALDQQLRTDIRRINEVLPGRQLLVKQSLLHRSRALRLMDRGWSRVDVCEEVGGGGLARFADMHHIASPGRVPLVAVARVGIVGRFNTLGRWGEFPLGLVAPTGRSAAPLPARLLPGPLVVRLPGFARGAP